MKKLMSLVFILFAILAYSQTNTIDPTNINQTDQVQLDQGKVDKQNCVMMKNGKMLLMKDGKTIDMKEKVTLKDGSVISTNGTLTMKDGKTKSLKNGDCVDMDGKWERIDMKEVKDAGKKKD